MSPRHGQPGALKPSQYRRWLWGDVSDKTTVVESAWGAVAMLRSARFPRPLAEPAVRVAAQRALHGICRQAWWATQGVGDLCASVPVSGDRALARLNSSIPSAVGLVLAARAGVVSADVLHFPRCSFGHDRITLCHTKFSRELKTSFETQHFVYDCSWTPTAALPRCVARSSERHRLAGSAQRAI